MNQLECKMLGIDAGLKSESEILEQMQQLLEYVTPELNTVELAIKHRELGRKKRAVEELVKDLTILKILGEALESKCYGSSPALERRHVDVPLSRMPSTLGEVQEHEPDKLPHEVPEAIPG